MFAGSCACAAATEGAVGAWFADSGGREPVGAIAAPTAPVGAIDTTAEPIAEASAARRANSRLDIALPGFSAIEVQPFSCRLRRSIAAFGGRA